tara:strand:- start:32932 stop:33342 length:411 start_codon:yes stop_codon:yes gene_type:complete
MKGRPTDYTEEIVAKALEYVEGAYEDEGQVVPTIEGLALYIGKARCTVYDWASQPEKKAFSDILEKCNAKQAVMLMSGALRNNMNANIAKLMLGKQGYSERSMQEITGANGGAIKTESTVEWVVEPVKPINNEKDS